MICKGSQSSIDFIKSFKLKDEDGTVVFSLDRVNFSNKIIYTGKESDDTYIGELLQDDKGADYYIISSHEVEVLRITKAHTMLIPKFILKSPRAKYELKYIYHKLEIYIEKNGIEALTFISAPKEYEINVIDEPDATFLLAAVFGVSELMISHKTA